MTTDLNGLYHQVVMDFTQHSSALENNRVLEFRLLRRRISLNLRYYITYRDEYYYATNEHKNVLSRKMLYRYNF